MLEYRVTNTTLGNHMLLKIVDWKTSANSSRLVRKVISTD